jgi:hypothetical protein
MVKFEMQNCITKSIKHIANQYYYTQKTTLKFDFQKPTALEMVIKKKKLT